MDHDKNDAKGVFFFSVIQGRPCDRKEIRSKLEGESNGGQERTGGEFDT